MAGTTVRCDNIGIKGYEDMASREVYSDWEGFDGCQKHYDDKKEKHYQAKIWWCLGVIGVGILISIMVRQVKDLVITQTYQCVEAEYFGNTGDRVHYFTEEGVELFYVLPGHSVKEKDGKVLLYYEEDMRYATAIDTFEAWLPYYIFFGVMSAISIWRLWRVYFGKKHYIGETESKEI